MTNNSPKLQKTFLKNHPLAEYTSWKIGGPAEYFYQPLNLEDLSQVLQNWEGKPLTIIGAASNVLIRDRGIKGLVIYLRNSLNKLEFANNELRVEAGTTLSYLTKKCSDLGMIDACFLAGIPGTVGGALKMNAGAHGNNIWNYVKKVETIDCSGKITLKNSNEFIASYRKIEGLQPNEWFVAAHLSFNLDDITKAKQQMQLYLKKRLESQPLDLPSCGSVFRNPQNGYAAKLIEECKLKGKKIGNAQVSLKHANFIVNLGGATAAEVENLIKEISATIEQEKNIKLIPEVHILGEK